MRNLQCFAYAEQVNEFTLLGNSVTTCSLAANKCELLTGGFKPIDYIDLIMGDTYLQDIEEIRALMQDINKWKYFFSGTLPVDRQK